MLSHLFFLHLFVIFLVGIQSHAAMGAAGIVLGLYLENRAYEKRARKDYFFYQYIEDHPEDFPIIGECIQRILD